MQQMNTALSLKQLYAQVDAPLEQARSLVVRQWTDAFHLVYGPGAAAPRLGGKLMRPALCFLSAGAVGATDLPHFVQMAAAMELLHLAALAHDDVVDHADTRRGEKSLNHLWDNHTAVLGGDYLVARALDILTHYDSSPVMRSALHSIHQMAEGELISFGRKQARFDEEDCIRLAEKKTASLFAVTCSCPAILLDSPYTTALYDFGMGMGTAFQLTDDLLDLDQDAHTLGKPSCSDLAEGKLTLPILYLKRAMNERDSHRLDAFKGNGITEGDRAWVREMLSVTGAREKTETLARDYIAKARTAIEALPQGSFTEAMLGIAEFVLLREA